MPADLASSLLDSLHTEQGLFGHVRAGGDWSKSFDSPDSIAFFSIVEGVCWYQTEVMAKPETLTVGDTLVTNGAQRVAFASEAGLVADAVPRCVEPERPGLYRYGDGSDFSMLGGGFQIRDRQLLLDHGLPSVIHIRRSLPEAAALGWLAVELVRETVAERSFARGAAVSAIAQLLIVKALRAHLAQVPPTETWWFNALGDSRVMRALDVIHSQPTYSWTIETLARRVGMSRTAFANRFREIMGTTPFAYLTRWRMSLAMKALRSGASIAQVAELTGYTSETAFNEAFKRSTGDTPGAYRRSYG